MDSTGKDWVKDVFDRAKTTLAESDDWRKDKPVKTRFILLTEEEYDNLHKDKIYNLELIIEGFRVIATPHDCIHDYQGREYCDECPISRHVTGMRGDESLCIKEQRYSK